MLVTCIASHSLGINTGESYRVGRRPRSASAIPRGEIKKGGPLEPPFFWPVVAEAPRHPTRHTKPRLDGPSYRDPNSTV